MKKILAACVLLSSLAFSQGGTDNVERMITMRGLETAMATIQKGFLRNNPSIVNLGTASLKKHLQDIDSLLIDPSDAAHQNFNPKVYAGKESAALTKLADEILESYKAGNKDESREIFSKTLSRCLACHKIIRKW